MRSAVLISFDPAARRLTISYARTVPSDLDELNVINIPLTALADKPRAAIVRLIGETAVDTLERFAGGALGLPASDNAALAAELDRVRELIVHHASAGAADAQYSVGWDALDRSLRTLNPSLIDTAVLWFKSAADQGFGPAQEMVADWERIKADYTHRIAKRKGGGN